MMSKEWPQLGDKRRRDCPAWAPLGFCRKRSGRGLTQRAAAGPGAYAFFSRTMMNLREKDDAWAAAFGGFMCGGVLGLPCTFPCANTIGPPGHSVISD